MEVKGENKEAYIFIYKKKGTRKEKIFLLVVVVFCFTSSDSTDAHAHFVSLQFIFSVYI